MSVSVELHASEALADDGRGEGASLRTEVRLRSTSSCPSEEELREVLRPLLPSARIVLSTSAGEGEVPRDGVHEVSWDDAGLFYDGESIKKRTAVSCRRLAEDWAVAVALLVDAPRQPEKPAPKPLSPPPKAPPLREKPRSNREVVLGLGGAALFPLRPDASPRFVGQLDAALLFGRWGFRVSAATTSSSSVPLEAAIGPTSAASASAAQSWLALHLLVEKPVFGVLWSAGLGPLIALDRVEGAGLGNASASSRATVGVDLALVPRARLSSTWSVGVPLGCAFFPSESVLEARNVTSGDEVRLGALPSFLPRAGLSIFTSF